LGDRRRDIFILMAMNYKPSGELRIEVGALGWKQNASARVVLQLRNDVRRHNQRQMSTPGFDGRKSLRHLANWLNRSSAQQVLGVYTMGSFEALEHRTAGDDHRARVTGRGICQVPSDAFDKRHLGKIQPASVEHEAMGCKATKRPAANLDRGEIPSRCKTVVSVGEEERFSLECRLQTADMGRISDRPDLVDTAKAVRCFRRRGLLHVQQRSERALQITAPKQETARIAIARMQTACTSGDTLGECLFVCKDRSFHPVQQSHHSFANGDFRFARETKNLAVEIQRGFSFLGQYSGAQRARRFLAGHVNGDRQTLESSKGQEYSHSERVTRAFA